MKPEEIRGLIPESSGRALRRMAALLPRDQAIVNIGVYLGRSVAFLASGAKGPVYAVDPWDLWPNKGGRFGFNRSTTFDQFVKNMYGYEVEVVRAFSVDAARHYQGPPVGLLFVDGDHHEASVIADVLAWDRHLAACALIVFDDYDDRHPQVKTAVAHLFGAPDRVMGSLAVVRKEPE